MSIFLNHHLANIRVAIYTCAQNLCIGAEVVLCKNKYVKKYIGSL